MELRISLHSMVDVITNSSTVIFVNTHGKTIEYAKDLINSLLSMSGSDKKADDFFTFELIPTEDSLERVMEYLLEECEHEWDSPEYRAKEKEFQKQIDDSLEDGTFDDKFGNYTANYNGWEEGELLITSKSNTGECVKLADQIQKIFSIDGERDG